MIKKMCIRDSANAAQADITELISLIENEEDVDADYLSSLLETYKDELEQLKRCV